MYSKIVNPKTGRKVLTKSRLGKKILQKYVLVMSGGMRKVKPDLELVAPFPDSDDDLERTPVKLVDPDTDIDADSDDDEERTPLSLGSPLSPRTRESYLPPRIRRFGSDPDFAPERAAHTEEVEAAASTAGRIGKQLLKEKKQLLEKQKALTQEKSILKDQNELMTEEIGNLKNDINYMNHAIEENLTIIAKLHQDRTSFVENLKHTINKKIEEAGKELDSAINAAMETGEKDTIIHTWETAYATFKKRIEKTIEDTIEDS